MAQDGTSGVVTLAPEQGERVRGVAAGLGGLSTDDLEIIRPELFEARRTGEIGLVHSWELVTAVDGPGTRMTIFLSGCPLRCKYCHNPDTMEMKEGTLEKIDDVVRRVLRYKPVFNASGGGLTLSGGEPLFQIAFTRRLLKAVHDAGVHTTIDTSGYLGARLTDEDLDNIDLFLLDVKSGDSDTYEHVTARQLQPTIDFGDRLHAKGKPVWVRFVVVPGLTDGEENVQRVADIVARWKGTVERVEVLPFHNMGADKWDKIDMDYELEDVTPPSPESVEHVRSIFRERGLTVF
ncbi:pyruvate formate-lyase-activating protein [Corynebacterium lujinxingii]|uniref:Pyruvate formate-lyase-activating enzyme n=1 Tax=Corynebacterium lujinxingii TaxID=2763010 RepID=A0A7H0JW31_9CORY|nr:pyruvate formate-lyase-activating protein [Corynebacterium lujinxingii]MBC3178730.1 pyruvate formate lyase-activating protein [Corynebacterium lujinxingii]NNO11012.1 pyruvate formate lyase-activating protein [Corynebacterium lujinxingii]QNP89247.1 pyruvate formate lyase-activating protein [Corynebacterium lujinxingii]